MARRASIPCSASRWISSAVSSPSVAELAEMLVRRDEQMAGRVGELVQDDERALAAADDEAVLDLARRFGAEDAAAAARRRG